MRDEEARGDTVELQNTLTTVTDWDGPDDPDNPRNFSLRRRTCSTIAVTFLAFVSTLAASVYSPGHEQVSSAFGVSDEVALLPLSLYSCGLAFGPLAGSPMSETFGRKAVFLTTTPLFALFTLGAGFSQNIASLIICRFFAGVFASPAISCASATIVDYTAGRYRAVSLAFYYSIPFFGAVFGPLLGGLLVEKKDWRWTQWVTLFFIAAFYIPILFTKETYKETILQRRARRLNVHQVMPQQKNSILATVKHFLTALFFRPIHMVITEPIVTLVCLYNGFLFGLMYTFVVASPWVFQHYYGFDLTGQSLSFLGLMVGTAFAPGPLIVVDLYLYQPRLRSFRASHSDTEVFPPEYRLYPSIIASFTLPTFLFIFAWTSRPTIHWMVPIVFQGLTIMATVMIYSSVNLFMVDAYGPLYGASAAGAAMLSRYGLSAAFPLFALQLFKTLGVGWATTLLGFCTLAMAPIPWLFWRYGDLLRAKTKYETSV